VFGFFYVTKIKYTVRGADYYCFCALITNNESEAQEKSGEVKTKGGAGYIYSADKFYIIASTYTDKTQAEAIVKKNGGSVIACSLPTLSFFDKNKANEARNVYQKITEHASFLISLSYSFDIGKESVEGVQNELKLYETSIKTEAIDVFSSLTLLRDSENVGVKVKYYICDLIFTAYKYFCQ